MDKYTSNAEKVLEKIGNISLTEDRVIKVTNSSGNRKYKDIQLDHIAGFEHERNLNMVLVIGAILTFSMGFLSYSQNPNNPVSVMLILFSLLLAVAALIDRDREYVIQSANSDLSIELPAKENVFEFWQKVNDQKNKTDE